MSTNKLTKKDKMKERIESVIICYDAGGVSIEYHDDSKRWQRMSGGFEKISQLIRNKDETIIDFLQRLKDHVWNKYLQPTEDKFGKLLESNSYQNEH